MIVLAFPADEAQRIVKGVQTVATYPDSYVPAIVVTVADLSELVGQTVAVARLAGRRMYVGMKALPKVEGAIVGSVTVAACVQISTRDQRESQLLGGNRALADCTPGRWALIFTDPAPCEQRCPWCHGTGAASHCRCLSCPCENGCDGDGDFTTCAPIPYTATGPIGEWTP